VVIKVKKKKIRSIAVGCAAWLLAFLCVLALCSVIFPLELPRYASYPLILLLSSPALLFALYVLSSVLPLPKSDNPRNTIKGFRQWAGLYVLEVLGILLYGFCAFMFDNLAPNLSLGYRVGILPAFVVAIILLIMTATRLRWFIDRLIWGNLEKRDQSVIGRTRS